MQNLSKTISKILFAFVLFVGISFIYTENVNAFTKNIDINKNEPIIITQGEDITAKDILKEMYYAGVNLVSNNQSVFTAFSYRIEDKFGYVAEGSGGYSNINSYTQIPIETNGLTLTEDDDTVEGTLTLVYINPSTGRSTNFTTKLIVVYNYLPTVTVPHIYLSTQQYDQFASDSIDILKNYVISQVKVTDVDNTITEINLYSYANENVAMSDLEKGKTTQFCVTINDLTKSVTVPCYVTVVKDEVEENVAKTKKVRSISEEFYPFHLSNIKKSSDGNYYAKMKNGIFYFIDVDNKFLLNKNGDKFPVDACLTNIIQKTATTNTDGIYKVIPLSKWVKDGNCMSLLTNCFSNQDGDKFVSSWSFSADDIITIQKILKNGKLDENFYYNYYSNGYCTLGTRTPNEIGREEDANEFDKENTGLVWYIANETLYIKAKKIDDEKYTYKIPNFKPSNTIMQNINSYQKDGMDASRLLATINNYSYQRTTAPWSSYNFKSVQLDDKITRIGDYAFFGCTSITEPIEIPDSCVEIGESAFMNCVNMSGDVQIKNVHTIGAFAFANCQELKGRLYLGQNALNKIEMGAFMNCGFTNSLSVPSSVSEIEDYAFVNCKNFTGSLILNDNLTKIGSYAFMNCNGFDGDLKLPSALNEISDFAFANCSGLNGILQMGNKIKSIGSFAFYNCYNLTGDIMLSKELEKVETAAFKGCRNLKSTLYINENLDSIGVEAFSGCVNITTINNDNQNDVLVIHPKAFFVDTGVVTELTSDAHNVNNNPVYTTFHYYNFIGDNRTIKNG